MDMVFRGKVWKFGDNISTDLLNPGIVLWGHVPREERLKYCLHAIRPGWTELVSKGDILVAGRNFGCGSSRSAHALLRELGIACIVAESIARLALRNAINSGYPMLVCPGITGIVEEGEELEVNIETGEVTNLTTGKQIKGEAFPPDSPPYQILKAGGIQALLRERLVREGRAPADILSQPLDPGLLRGGR